MLKKIKAIINGISVRIMLGYLSILCVPLLTITVIYFVSSQALLDYQKEQTRVSLEKTAATIRLRFDELNNISTYINANPGVNSVINTSNSSPGKRDIALIHSTLNSIPPYKLTNQLIKQIYIFFIEASFVGIPPHGFGLTEQTYLSNIAFHGTSYQDLEAISRGSHVSTLRFSQDEKGRDILLLRNMAGSRSLIAIQLDMKALEALLSSHDAGPQGATCLMNRQGQLLAQVGEGTFSAEQLQHTAAAEGGFADIKQDGESYLRYTYPYGGLTYVSLVQTGHLLQKISAIKYLIASLSLAALALSLIMCTALWSRRQKVVHQVASTARRLCVLDEAAMKSEGRLLQSAVSSLADRVDALQMTLGQQQEALAYSVLRGLLQGSFGAYSDMDLEIERAGLKLDAPYYWLVNVIFSQPELSGDSMLSYRLMLKRFIKQQLQRPCFICDMDNASFALMLPEDEEQPAARHKALFMDIMVCIGQAGYPKPSFTISALGSGPQDLAELYRQTRLTADYMACLNLQGVYHVDDIPPDDEALSLPIEREMQLANIIQARPVEELQAFWQQILLECGVNGRLGAEALVSLRERIRKSILHSLSGAMGEGDINSLMLTTKRAQSLEGLYQCARYSQQALHALACQQGESRHQQAKALIYQAIEGNYHDAGFGISALADMTGMAENSLYRAMKSYFGLSFAAFLEQYRLEKAILLLKAHVPIREVAERVGYTSDHSFRRAFKRAMKVSPSQFYEA